MCHEVELEPCSVCGDNDPEVPCDHSPSEVARSLARAELPSDTSAVGSRRDPLMPSSQFIVHQKDFGYWRQRGRGYSDFQEEAHRYTRGTPAGDEAESVAGSSGYEVLDVIDAALEAGGRPGVPPPPPEVDEHVVTGCDDCVVEHHDVCLLDSSHLSRLSAATRVDRACPDWCRLRRGAVTIRLEPDE